MAQAKTVKTSALNVVAEDVSSAAVARAMALLCVTAAAVQEDLHATIATEAE
jgi:hypothetical protein